jgi:hypothetical protein
MKEMRMNKRLVIATLLFILIVQAVVFAQTDEPPRYEVAAEFTTLNRDEFARTRVEPGIGARFTFNFNKNFAIEGAVHGSFNDCFNCQPSGHVFDLFGGIKAGKRYKSWGIFAKARPGDVSFPSGRFKIIQTGTTGSFPFQFQAIGLDSFAADLGGVVEFYPSRRIVTRFDAGDTIIHFSRRTDNGLSFDPATGMYTIVPFTTPAKTTHNFQFVASVGFRF